jgi:hypothetical protein
MMRSTIMAAVATACPARQRVMGLMSAPANPNGMTPAPISGGQSKVPVVQ